VATVSGDADDLFTDDDKHFPDEDAHFQGAVTNFRWSNRLPLDSKHGTGNGERSAAVRQRVP